MPYIKRKTSASLPDSGFNNGRTRYGNTMTHFSDDGRLITNQEDINYPRQNRRLPDLPDYRSYDPGRDRRRYERYQDDNWRDREIAREREREYRIRESYRAPATNDHARHYPSNHYGGNLGNRDYNHAPVYGRTLPLPLSRDTGPPTRHFDDFRARDMRPNYEKSTPNLRRWNNDHSRTYDWRMPVSGNRYDQGGIVASRNYGGRYGVLATNRRSRWTEQPVGWYFIIAGIFLLLSGLINLTICVPNYYYCFLWMSLLTLFLGAVGIWHGGRYKDQWKNLYYVGHGSVVALAAMVASGLVLFEYITLVKEIAENSNVTAYYTILDARAKQPLVKVPTSHRVWVCLTFDSVGLMFVVGDYMALYAVILVAHELWNHKKKVSKSVAPYCQPRLFNPFMEMLWGELLVLVGLVSVFGCYTSTNYIKWYSYWIAVGVGLFVLLVGAISSWAAKTPTRTSVAAVAITFNFFGILACVAAVVIMILGIKDNVEALDAGKDHKEWLVASALIYSFVLAVALICFFYCLGLFVRFCYYLTKSGYDRDTFTVSSRSDQTVSTVPHRYGYDKERGYDTASDPPLPYRTPKQGLFGRRY